MYLPRAQRRAVYVYVYVAAAMIGSDFAEEIELLLQIRQLGLEE